MKAVRILSLIAIGCALSACQGANPFQRSTDPLKDYGALKNYSAPSDLKDERPEISLGADYPVGGISSDKATKFKVNVYDPHSTQTQSDDQKAALKSALQVVANAALEDDERDGSSAASCALDGQPSLGNGNWQYDCTFDPSKITGLDATANYVFDLKIKSVFSNLDELVPVKVSLAIKANAQGSK